MIWMTVRNKIVARPWMTPRSLRLEVNTMSKTAAGLIQHCKDKLGTPLRLRNQGRGPDTDHPGSPGSGESRHIYIHLQGQGRQVHRPALHGLLWPHQLVHRAHPRQLQLSRHGRGAGRNRPPGRVHDWLGAVEAGPHRGVYRGWLVY